MTLCMHFLQVHALCLCVCEGMCAVDWPVHECMCVCVCKGQDYQDPYPLSTPQDPCLRKELLPRLDSWTLGAQASTRPPSTRRRAEPRPPQVTAATRAGWADELPSCGGWGLFLSCLAHPGRVFPSDNACFSTRLFRPRNVLFVSQAETPKPPLW